MFPENHSRIFLQITLGFFLKGVDRTYERKIRGLYFSTFGTRFSQNDLCNVHLSTLKMEYVNKHLWKFNEAWKPQFRMALQQFFHFALTFYPELYWLWMHLEEHVSKLLTFWSSFMNTSKVRMRNNLSLVVLKPNVYGSFDELRHSQG